MEKLANIQVSETQEGVDTRELEKIIRSEAGTSLFSVTFTKKNGEKRDMVCRLGVKRGITGKGMAFDPRQYGLLTVCDVNAAKEKGDLGFRNLNLETLERIKINGVTYRRKENVFVVENLQ